MGRIYVIYNVHVVRVLRSIACYRELMFCITKFVCAYIVIDFMISSLLMMASLT